MAVLEDMGSSLLVTFNAMRLFNTKTDEAWSDNFAKAIATIR
jgi:hypothetical protein